MLHKACIGAGLSVGLAEDVSCAGRWLCGRNQDGVAAVLMSIQRELTAVVPPVNTASRWTFADANAAVFGPSAIDLLLAGDLADEVCLSNVDSPWLLLGLTGAAADTFGGYWRIDTDRAFVELRKNAVSVPNNWPGSATDLVITHQPQASPSTLVDHAMQQPLDALPIARAEHASALLDRIAVPDELWRQTEMLAARTYVPATAASRLAGAGAGLTDND